jgi:primosomal protein N' (replication factor Y)
VALLTLKGRNEDKVRFSAEHLKRELEKNLVAAVCDRRQSDTQGRAGSPLPAARTQTDDGAHLAGAGRPTIFKDLIIAGPAPAPLLRAETFYRYQIMLRTRAMSKLSQALAKIIETLALPEDVTLMVDIDPVSLG